MNVWLSLLVIQTFPAPTHLDPSHVDATWDTLETEWLVMVGILTVIYQVKCNAIGWHVDITVPKLFSYSNQLCYTLSSWQHLHYCHLGGTFCIANWNCPTDPLCRHQPHWCNLLPADINECVTQSPCHPSASCTNTLGSFTCGCNTGYTGDGMSCYGECLHVDYFIQDEVHLKCLLWV